MTKNDFVPLFTMLCEVYNREPSKTLMLAYYTVLEDLTKEEFEGAVKNILSSRKYSTLPLPSDILEYKYGNADDNAILALKTLEEAMERQGSYNSVCFKDEAISSAVLSMGGWIAICRTSTEDWKFVKKEFINLYKALTRNPSNLKKDITHLVGWNEHQNRIAGYDNDATNEDVTLIGFDEIRNEKIKVYQLPELKEKLNIITPKIENQNKVVQMLVNNNLRIK